MLGIVYSHRIHVLSYLHRIAMASLHSEIVSRQLHLLRLIWNMLRVVHLPETRYSEKINSIECVVHDFEVFFFTIILIFMHICSFFSQHFILTLQIQGTFIHMHIPEKFVQRWFKKFKEGGVYRICRFQVVYNTYRNKTTTHRYMLNFSEKITIGVLKDVDLPRYIYDKEDYNFFWKGMWFKKWGIC